MLSAFENNVVHFFRIKHAKKKLKIQWF